MSNLLQLAAGGGHGDWYLDPHAFGLVFWTALIFSIVLAVLYKYAWGPLLTVLEQREEAIAGSIDDAQRIKKEAEEVKQRYEDQLENVRQDAQAIIDEGEADKKRIIKEAHTRAAKEAQEIRDRAERDIELAKNKALAEVQNEARTLGVLIAAKVIDAEIDATRHEALIEQVVTTYEAAK